MLAETNSVIHRKRIILILVSLASANALAAGRTTIDIDLTRRGPAINPRMYGIFLEEINHGVDGGLYAELVRNRAFEDSRPPEGYALRDGRWVDEHGFPAGFSRFGYSTETPPFWSLVRTGDAQGEMHLQTTGGITEASSYCLRLEIERLANGRVGVANEGFFGIGIKEGQSYALSLHAKGGDGLAGPISVYLEDGSGQPCSNTAEIEGVSGTWKPFKAQLTATTTESKARLVILAGDTGTLWLDFVSLLPAQTWKDRPNGLRADIAQMIADLEPGFVRFPGGCVVEGGTIETAYNWKDTLGPVTQRPERWGPWNYRRTHGMGLYEYLQFCEDLNAEPLWVGFVGQTCIFRQRENVPMDQMGPVRDSFLDIIEYANGPTDSPWGALRAKAGHPTPFGLEYIEIGNENQGRAYEERYCFVYDALKAKYPDLAYLADLSWTSRESMSQATFDIEDRHYYNAPRWFTARYREYDGRDHTLPPLYLGEVAVTSGDGGPLRGNLLAALSEGVFLLGCERNADAVRMVSYAPLLAHVEGRTELTDAPPPWHAMIYFDGTRAFGTASYYLWKLLGTNRPTYTIETKVTLADAGPTAIAGAVGVGTWNTAAEFKNIRVEKNGEALYQSDFVQDATDWRTEGGAWAVVDGVYQQSRQAVGLSTIGDEAWSDYKLTLKARKRRGAEGFLIVFGRQGQNKYWWNLGGWGNTRHALEYNQTPVGRTVPGRIETDRWYDVKIVLTGDRIRCYLDGQLVHEATAPKNDTFFATAGRDERHGDIVIRAINLADEPVTATLNLRGAGRIESKGTLTVLTADQLSDNNSLDNPTRVVPQQHNIEKAGETFDHVLGPRSFSLLRLKTK